jgi:uncharacterized membrane protein HdeD (DUF308 family)
MKQFLAKHWWIFLLRGIFGVVFGILAFTLPLLTLATLIIVWGAYAFVDGIVALWAALTGQTDHEHRWLLGLQGLIGVVAGIITFIVPAATGLGLLILIAAWSLAIGVLQIVTAIRLRKEITGEFWLGLSGLISVLFAFFVIARPGEGALAIVWIIGSYALIFGIVLIAFAFRVKGAATTEHQSPL